MTNNPAEITRILADIESERDRLLTLLAQVPEAKRERVEGMVEYILSETKTLIHWLTAFSEGRATPSGGLDSIAFAKKHLEALRQTAATLKALSG